MRFCASWEKKYSYEILAALHDNEDLRFKELREAYPIEKMRMQRFNLKLTYKIRVMYKLIKISILIMRGEYVELPCPFCDKGKILFWLIPRIKSLNLEWERLVGNEIRSK